ncbi:MAG: ABC transporter permease [Terracidiphilus sp.]
MFHRLHSLWQYIFRKNCLDRELDEELQAYVEMVSDEKMRQGMSREEAYRDARREIGGIDGVKQSVRDVRIGVSMEKLLQDIRYGFRVFIKNPSFSLVAVATLALGIGANTVIYTLVDSILLQPLPYEHQGRLMRITATTGPAYPKGWIRILGENSKAFSSLAGFDADTEYNVSDSELPDRVFGARITTNAFDTQGIHPALGEFFSAQDAIAGQDHDVVLSYGYWRQHFGGAPNALGRTIRIEGVSRRIMASCPPVCTFPMPTRNSLFPCRSVATT